MAKFNYSVIGVMSGTSRDGIDLAYIKFEFDSSWSFNIIIAETLSYSDYWRNLLGGLTQFSLDELKQIDIDYTVYLAEKIDSFITKNNINTIDAICSHGHTALHQPEKSFTYQIGNLPELAKILKQTVVCDFRIQDVAFGGQGAPLVPIGDKLLFPEYDYCLNLGGFANVSTEAEGARIAFDICPVNIVLNHYVNSLGLDYDDEGKLAKTGTIDYTLLNQLNSLAFFKSSQPKSLGLEWVESTVFPLINKFDAPIETLLRTYIEHIAIQIVKVINTTDNASVLASGGGVFNTFLMDRISALTQNEIVFPSKEIIEFKEALIFGFLGVLKLRNETNCLSSVTGAKEDHSSGMIFRN